MDKVVITGLGMISSFGMSFQDFRRKIQIEEPKVDIKQHWSGEDLGKQYVFNGPEIDINDYYENLRAPLPLRYSQLSMLGCRDALIDANLMDYEYNMDRVGMIINTKYGAWEANEDYMKTLIRKGPRKVSPFKFSQTVSNVCLGDVCRQYQLRGPSSLLYAESSLKYGYDLLKNDQADVMICGGVDALIDFVFGHYKYHNFLLPCEQQNNGFSYAAYLSDVKKNTHHSKAILGECAAFVVLEKERNAIRRQTNIYAELVDYYTLFDPAYHLFDFERDPKISHSVIVDLLQRNGMTDSEIDGFVGAANTAWFYNTIEQPVLEEVFSDFILYASAKPFIGETFGSAGQAAMALAVLLLQPNFNGVGLPLPSTYAASEKIVLDAELFPKVIKKVLVSSLTYGGNNTCFLISKYQ